ncbi:hypothetical protein FAES_1103 [Fibrella aestuarina BUZ 2]|uniref:DUF4142 domain-containing protein n=2 Tax=Fibrella TaxID=861914 RepID=I0K4R0_9BACT|nr:hypothetical protein FAES_1103 [Fibrella aestuarina BUZ 2]
MTFRWYQQNVMNMNNSATRAGLIGITTVCLLLVAIGLLTVVTSCSTDSTDKVKQANDKRIDGQAAVFSNEAKDDAKSMADKMVDLASMQQTANQLSQEASRRATNPQVKAYAQRVISANQQADNELRRLATELKIELPATLSSEGKDRLADLQHAEPGVALDLKYLDEMSKVAKKSANAADDLADAGTTDAVRSYGKKLKKTQEDADDAIKQLKNAIN